MSHCDQDTLSLLALGESADSASAPQDTRHLAGCSECRAELEALRALVGMARTQLRDVLVHDGDGHDATAGQPATLLPPPPRVWDRIADATGVTTRPQFEVVVEPVAPATNGFAGHSPAVVSSASPIDGEPPVDDAPLSLVPGRSAEPRRRRRRWDAGTAIGMAAVTLIIGGLGGFGIATWVQGREDTTTATAPAVVAGTALGALPPAPGAAGDASVVQTGSIRRLDVDVRRLDPTTGFYEVWLISPDITQMVSVGVLDGPTGQFTLPAGIDLQQLPLVDISIQSYDGSGAHSGQSVLRGTLS